MTRIEKNIRDGWQATTDFDLGNNRRLIVTTSKRYDKTLTTTATVHTVSETDGRKFLTHAIRRDYHKTFLVEKVRVTEKAVEAQHIQVLNLVSHIKRQIAIHYGEAEAPAVAA